MSSNRIKYLTSRIRIESKKISFDKICVKKYTEVEKIYGKGKIYEKCKKLTKKVPKCAQKKIVVV